MSSELIKFPWILISFLIQVIGYVIAIQATYRLACATMARHRLPHEKLGIKPERVNFWKWMLEQQKISNDEQTKLGIVWPKYDKALRQLVFGMLLQLAGMATQFVFSSGIIR